MGEIKKIKGCVSKVLPTVYTECLSYEEVLGKVIDKINEIIDVINDTEVYEDNEED